MTTPGWRRSLLLRRAAALVLLAAAVVTALRSAGVEDPQVVVFVRDVAAGRAVTADDVELRAVPPEFVPAGALTSAEEVGGRVVVAAAGVGEVATDSRFLGATLTAELVSGSPVQRPDEPANMVPLKLAEPEILPLLHHGDTVTIVTHAGETGEPEVVAAGGRVILASMEEETAGSGAPGTVLVALPESDARAVAAAALSTPLAVVLTGERATGRVDITPTMG